LDPRNGGRRRRVVDRLPVFLFEQSDFSPPFPGEKFSKYGRQDSISTFPQAIIRRILIFYFIYSFRKAMAL
jgi:hypothetical protein